MQFDLSVGTPEAGGQTAACAEKYVKSQIQRLYIHRPNGLMPCAPSIIKARRLPMRQVG